MGLELGVDLDPRLRLEGVEADEWRIANPKCGGCSGV
jgi:hypothetical protein